MITREQIIATASSAGIQLIWDGKFGREDYQSIMGSFPSLERFYSIAATSRDVEVAELREHLRRSNDSLADEMNISGKLREHVTLLRDAVKFWMQAEGNYDLMKSDKKFQEALAITEQKS